MFSGFLSRFFNRAPQQQRLSLAVPTPIGSPRGSDEFSGLTQLQRGTLTKTGILPRHAKALLDLCRSNDMVLVFCPVPPDVAKKLAVKEEEEHLYAGKPLKFKGKSAKSGAKGEVPVNQRYSKLAEEITDKVEREKEIAYYQALNDSVLEHYRPQLRAAQAKIAELREQLTAFQQTHHDFAARRKKIKELGVNKEATRDVQDAEIEEFCRKIAKEVDTLNNLMIAAEVDKVIDYKEGIAEQKSEKAIKLIIHCVEDDKGEPLRDKKGRPVYAIKINNKWKKYDHDREEFIENFKLPRKGYKVIPFKVMGRKKWKFNLDKFVIEERSAIYVSDYDELVSAPRKRWPFSNNNEIRLKNKKINDKSILRREEFLELAQADKFEEAVSWLLAYEEQLKVGHRDRDRNEPGSEGVGRVNLTEWAFKTAQGYYTENATNHGAEVNNPHPRKWVDGNFRYFTPEVSPVESSPSASPMIQSRSGHLGLPPQNKKAPKSPKENPDQILGSEKAVLEFINTWRLKGFPLDVNARWGWECDMDSGILTKPAVQFDWEEVENELTLLETLLKDAMEAKREEEQDEENKIEDTAATSTTATRVARYQARIKEEKEIIQLKVEIEALKLESPIIYGDPPTQPCILRWEKCVPAEQTEGFDLRVAQEVRKREVDLRRQKIAELEAALEARFRNYRTTYKEECIIQKCRDNYNTALQTRQTTDQEKLSDKEQGISIHLKSTGEPGSIQLTLPARSSDDDEHNEQDMQRQSRCLPCCRC